MRAAEALAAHVRELKLEAQNAATNPRLVAALRGNADLSRNGPQFVVGALLGRCEIGQVIGDQEFGEGAHHRRDERPGRALGVAGDDPEAVAAISAFIDRIRL